MVVVRVAVAGRVGMEVSVDSPVEAVARVEAVPTVEAVTAAAVSAAAAARETAEWVALVARADIAPCGRTYMLCICSVRRNTIEESWSTSRNSPQSQCRVVYQWSTILGGAAAWVTEVAPVAVRVIWVARVVGVGVAVVARSSDNQCTAETVHTFGSTRVCGHYTTNRTGVVDLEV